MVSVSSGEVRPLAVHCLSCVTFVPARLLKNDLKLTSIGVDRQLKDAFAELASKEAGAKNLNFDRSIFKKGAASAKSVRELVRLTRKASSPGSSVLAATSAAALRSIPPGEAFEAVSSTLKNQLGLEVPVAQTDKLSKWNFSPSHFTHFSSMLKAYYRNVRIEKLVPPMRLSDIEHSTRVSHLVDALVLKHATAL